LTGLAFLVAMSLLAMGLAGGCFWRLLRYRLWFRLPPRRDDCLEFRGSYRSVAVRLSAQGFDLPPELAVAGRTVLLRMTVAASWLGRLFDPFIEFEGGGQVCRQYLERGVSGQRYLNLSALFNGQDSCQRVQLRGSWLGWQPSAALLVFDSPPGENMTVLVLAPHPDDAEIAAFGMYAFRKSWVVTMTAGEQGSWIVPERIAATEHSRWAALLRVSDSLTVPQLGEVPPERLINLACPDGALESMFREPSRVFPLACEAQLSRAQLRAKNGSAEFQHSGGDCTWNNLIRELQLLLELSQPDMIICPHPQGDAHPDHIFTTVALERSLRSVPGKRPLLLLYTVHSQGAPAYPFGPSESVVGPPPGVCSSWLVDSVYSRQLAPAHQQAKRFAVEANHAVRGFIPEEPATVRAFLKILARQISGFISGMGVSPASLLRRACRPNELYYVVRGEQLPALVAAIADGSQDP
jgi:LmbE family N-acetylglucosaminyl deacetylase